MTRPLKLLIVIYHRFELWRAPEWFAERVRSEFANVHVVRREDYDGIESDLRDTDVLMSWAITPEQFAVAGKLRWIHSPTAAVHRLITPEVVNSDIVVTSARGVHGPVVAEHVIALVLAMAKRLPSAVRLQTRREWGQQSLWNEMPRPREIAGATLGLVGVGTIGAEVARLAAALGMRVVAVRASKVGAGSAHIDRIYHTIDDMLPNADYVVLAAPVTPETVGMINARRLAAMKSDAYLINVARGALIDEPALVDALRRHRIAGAALDVFEHEPLPSESPLWDLENVFITPHSAALTDRLWERHLHLLSENLRRFQQGKTLLGLVDKSKGY